MGLGKLISETVAAEQARLAALPHRRPGRYDGDDEKPTFYTLCLHSGRLGKPLSRRETGMVIGHECSYCHVKLSVEAAPDGELPEHSRLLYANDHAEELIDALLALLGLNPHGSDDALRAKLAARDARRTPTLAGKVAAGLPFVTAALLRQDATAGAQQALHDLNELKLEFVPGRGEPFEDGSTAPFFSEAVLYELLGKEDARTMLSYVNALNRAAGYVGGGA